MSIFSGFNSRRTIMKLGKLIIGSGIATSLALSICIQLSNIGCTCVKREKDQENVGRTSKPKKY